MGTSAEEADGKEADRRGGLWRALVKMRRFLACCVLFGTYDHASIDPMSASLYTMVSCPRPMPTADGHCPLGSTYSNHTCEAEAPSSKSWSLSAHCLDKNEVIGETARLKGKLGITRNVAELFALVFAGPAIDNVGRKPVLMLGLASQVAFCACMLLSSSINGSDNLTRGVLALLLTAFIFLGTSASIFQPAASAMVADLSHGNEKLRADGFSALGMTQGFSFIVGFGAMYPVLKSHLSDYAPMWAAFTVGGIFSLVVSQLLLHESMPSAHGEGSEQANDFRTKERASCCQTALGEVTRGMQIVCGEPFLRLYIVLAGLALAAFKSCMPLLSMYAISAFGYDSAKASLVGVIIPIMGVFASAATSPLVRTFGLRRISVMALLIQAVGFLLLGVGGPLPSIAESLYWAGLVIAGCCHIMSQNCHKMIVSMHVGRDSQGSAFATFALVEVVFDMSGHLLWSLVFFRPASHGWRLGAPFLASSSVLGLAAVSLAILWKVVGKPADNSEESSDESSGQENTEESDSDNSGVE